MSKIYKNTDTSSVCSVSGKPIQRGDSIIKFEIKKKGYGAYSILRSEIE